MPRYIKADKEYLEPFFYEHLTDNGMIAAQNAIDEVPTADVQDVKHGKWMHNNGFFFNQAKYYCSLCGEEVNEYKNYCPHCGAKMDGKD